MDHVAIMNSKLALIPDIISGKKRIESRWYKTKRVPWNKIIVGDTIYFKESGKEITAKAGVEKVLQYELNKEKIKEIIEKYGGEGGINLKNRDPNNEFYSTKNYCVLILLKNPQTIEPFNINKKGFGSGVAWITTKNIKEIKI
ncbi:MAG: hypothetical protein AABW73_00310 [Nanoarchaeota archaeon]